MSKRFPLVIDYDDNNKIIELPAGDCLNLENSDICNVGNITVVGGKLTIDGKNVSAFSGYYQDLIDAPFIPETLIDLGIIDGTYDQVLHTDGAGGFRFRDIRIDYSTITGLPDIPDNLLDLNIVDGNAGDYLRTNGDGTFEFVDLGTTLLGTIRFNGNTITSSISDPIIIDPVTPGYVQIGGTWGTLIPRGGDAERLATGGLNLEGMIRFNIDSNQFEGLYLGNSWGTLGGVRSTDGDTYITAEEFPGKGDNTLTFVTGSQTRLTITDDGAVFDNSTPVTMDTLNVNNLVLHTQMGLKGDIEIGDEQSDTLTILSRIVGDLNPKYTKSYNLGSDDLKWKNFYLDGQAYINDYMLPDMNGKPGQLLVAKDESWGYENADFFGGNRVYVSQKYGSDYNDGINRPVRTIKRGLEIASELVWNPTSYNEVFEAQLSAAYKNIIKNVTRAAVISDDTFTFDIGQAERDFDALLNAFKYDVAFNTNYNRIALGDAFTRRAEQFLAPITAAQGDFFTQLKDRLAELTFSDNVRSEMTTIIDEFETVRVAGFAAAPALSCPAPKHSVTKNAETVHQLLLDNAEFLSHEADLYFTNNNLTVTFPKIEFRDTIIKLFRAIAYDVIYGGNTATKEEAKYQKIELDNIFGANVSLLPDTYTHIKELLHSIIKGETVTPIGGNPATPTIGAAIVEHTETEVICDLVDYVTRVLANIPLPTTVKPSLKGVEDSNIHGIETVYQNKEVILEKIIDFISTQYNFYNPTQYRNDIKFIIDSISHDIRFDGNAKTIEATQYYLNYVAPNYDQTNFIDTLGFIRLEIANAFSVGAHTTKFLSSIDIITDTLTGVPIPVKIYGEYATKRVGVIVAPGDYNELNPIVVPDFVSIIGEQGVVIRPRNADKDIFRVRNNTNLINLTFKDYIDLGGVPIWTWRYAVTIDDTKDWSIDVTGMAEVPRTPVVMTIPFTVQNCYAISVLGGSGAEVDGKLVHVLDAPPLELNDNMPETGYAGLLNGLAVTSFGGNAVRVTNDARVQAVGCSALFNEIGFLTQTGGLLNTISSSSSYGYFNLRSSGTTEVLLDSDVGTITDYGEYRGRQLMKVNGLKRPAIEHYEIRVFDSVGEVTGDYTHDSILGVEQSFIPAASVLGNIIDFGIPHSFVSGSIIEYDSNGDHEVIGLKNGLTYYVYVPHANKIALFHDEKLSDPVSDMDAKFCQGTHYIRADYEKIYAVDILDEHNVYQDIQLPSSNTYTIVKGNTIYGTDGTNSITATIANWDPATFVLTVGIELTQVGTELKRNKFVTGATIDTGIVSAPSAATVITVNDRDDLYSSTFTINTSRDRKIRALPNTMTKQIKMYRPSICNAIQHVWNFPGSGIDYNALPQHGGLIKRDYESVNTLPGRVYAQGTNEAGDFRIGNLVEAYQRAGRIDFNSKLSIQGLEVLAFANEASTPVNFISSDVELGDKEFGGASNERLVTQLAARSFLDKHLGTFYDKRISNIPEPSAVVQLNSRGQLNAELLADKSTYTAHVVPRFKDRFNIHKELPVKDLKAGDIVIEEYYEVVLTLSALMSFTEGEVLSQPATGAKGVVKENYVNDNRIRLLVPEGTFSEDITHGIESDIQGPLVDPVSGGVVYNYETYGPSQRRDNYFINTTAASQYLVLADTFPHTFTTKIGFAQKIYGATSGAVGVPKEHRKGCLTKIDNSKLPTGSGYADGTYELVQLITTTSTGTGALADITVSGGQIVSIDLRRPGSGYDKASIMKVAESAAEATVDGASFIPTVGAQASIEASEIEHRLYVDIDPNVALHFYATDNNLDFITDDSSQKQVIPLLNDVTTYEFYGYAVDPTIGGVDTTNNTITFEFPHTLTDGDYIVYDSNGYPAIGGLVTGQTYYAEVIDTVTIRLYYTYGMLPGEKVVLTKTERGNQYFHRPVVNTLTNQFYLPTHGFSIGDPIQFWATQPPGNVNDGEFFFVGSITANTFSIHKSRRTALDSNNGTIIASHDILTSGTGSADLQHQTVIVSDSVNTSGEFESSWTTLMKTEIDGDDVVTGTVKAKRLGRGIPTDEKFLRGDNTWQYAVESIKTTNDTSEVVITGKDHNIGPDKVWHSDINIHVNYASYDDPAAPNLGEETAGIAAFHFDHFEIETGQGLVNTKPSTRGGEIDAKYLDGEDGVYWRNPIHHSRAVPVEWGGTNQNEYAQGDILYAATNLGDGSFTQVLERLPIGNPNAMLMSDGTVPQWSSSATLNGMTVGDIQIAITDRTVIDTVPGSANLTLDSDSGEIVVIAKMDILNDVDISENLNIAGDTTSLGWAIYKDIKIGVDFDNMISTQLYDLRIKPITGDTYIESTLTVTDDVLMQTNLTVDLNTTINQDLHVVSDTQIDETLTVNLHANIYDVRIGVAQPNEIDTSFGDLVLDSNTGLTIIDDDLRVTQTSTFDSDITITGNITYDGNTTQVGNNTQIGNTDIDGVVTIDGDLRVDELQFGKTVDNEIDTVSTDLILDSATGKTIIDDKLDVTDDVNITANVQIIGNTALVGDTLQVGNTDTSGNVKITGEIYVDDLQLGNTLPNEIDTATMDLILDSATGNTIIDDRLEVTDDVTVNADTYHNGNITHIGDTTHQGVTTQTGTTNIIGYLNVDGETRMDDIVVGVTQSFELEAINGQELWLDSAAGLTVVDDDLQVTGNLTVLGTMTTVATTEMVVSDKNIILADGSGSAIDADGAGITIDIGTNAPAIDLPTILYDAVDDSWDFNKDINIEGFKFNSTSYTNTLAGLTSDTITVNTLTSLTSVNVTGTISATGMIDSDTGFTTPGTISATGPGYIESIMGFTTPGTIFANGTITSPGGFVGNADTSSKWFTPRTVYFQDDAVGNLTDVNGQFTIDGSGDVMEVVLTIRKEKVQDYIGELIVTDGTHTGITVDYFDNGDGIKGNMNFAIDQPWMWDFTGQMFTANTETGITTRYNQVDRKIDLDINYDEMKDAMSAMFTSTLHDGIAISYDTLNKTLAFSAIDENIESTVGTWLKDSVGKGIDITYDTVNNQMTFDVKDPVITLTGDIQGSATMTDLGDVSIETTMITKAVTLGLNTSGDYVEDLEQGDGIFLEFTGGEGSRPKINHANTSSATNVTLTQTPSSGPTYGGGIVSFDYVSYMTLDTFGHIADVTIDQLRVYQGYDIQVAPLTDYVAGTIGTQEHIWEQEIKYVGSNKTKITHDPVTSTIYWDTTDTYLVSATWDPVSGDVTIVQHEDTEIDKTDGTTITTNVLPDIILSIPETLDTLTSRGNITTNGITIGTLTGNGDATFNATVSLGDAATDKIHFNGQSATHLIPDTDVTHDLGTATLQWNNLYVQNVNTSNNASITGTLDVDGQTTLASLNVEDLTATRVVYVGTNGELVDDPDMTFNGTTLSVNGISTAAATSVGSTLSVGSNATVGGTLGVTGATTLSSTLAVSSATTLNSTLTVKGSTTLGDNAGVDAVSFNSRVNTTVNPKTDNSYDLGSASLRWQDVYAMTGNFSGDITNNAATSRYNFTGGYLQGTSTSTVLAFGSTTLNMTANTITPGTDNTYSLGSSSFKWNTVYATLFNGTASKAYYADLAENYVADKEYPPGTVMMLGGDKEVTAAVGPATTKVVGVVSTAPAYLMNSGLEAGTPIALKGRVPCLVVGKVNKGDLLVTSHIEGVATVTTHWIGGAVIGKAIESSDNADVKIIEIAVGVL